jgi:putative membrane protein
MIPICIQIVELMKLRSRNATIFMAWLMIQTGSMMYELFEWLLTIIVSSEAANNYNGQQGDVWDAQKDMALALVGSTLSALFALAFIKNRKYRFK